jgi:hypothetical protein
MDTSKLTLSTRDDLNRSVKGECGEDICSEIGYVVATAPNGQRFAHRSTFEVVSIGYDEFPFSYRNKEQRKALEQCLKDQKALQEAGKLSLGGWDEINPVYGSESWGPEQEWELAQLDCNGG